MYQNNIRSRSAVRELADIRFISLTLRFSFMGTYIIITGMGITTTATGIIMGTDITATGIATAIAKV